MCEVDRGAHDASHKCHCFLNITSTARREEAFIGKNCRSLESQKLFAVLILYLTKGNNVAASPLTSISQPLNEMRPDIAKQSDLHNDLDRAARVSQN